MKLNTKDWNKLKSPVLLLTASIVLISFLIYFAYTFYQAQTQLAQSQQLQLQAIRAKLQLTDTEKKEIELFLPQYEALIAQGFIGEEHRNAWINTIIEIQKNNQLFEINYEIGPFENFNQNYLTGFSPFTLHQSRMKINFDLLHEGDLITFTERLAAKNISAWLLKSCEITQATAQSLSQARLHADCEINWLTLNEPQKMQSAESL